MQILIRVYIFLCQTHSEITQLSGDDKKKLTSRSYIYPIYRESKISGWQKEERTQKHHKTVFGVAGKRQKENLFIAEFLKCAEKKHQRGEMFQGKLFDFCFV